MLNTFYTLRTQFISLIVAVCVCVKTVSLILYTRITSLSLRVSVSNAGFTRLRLKRRLCASAMRVSVLTVSFPRLRLVRLVCASPSRPSACRVSVSTVGFARLRLDRRFCASPSRASGLCVFVSTIGIAYPRLDRHASPNFLFCPSVIVSLILSTRFPPFFSFIYSFFLFSN